jgi:PAS domain S-box-containing protein
LLDALPTALYATDAEGRITYFNEAAAQLAGRVPDLEHDRWCVSWRLRSMNGLPLPHEQCPMAIALRENRPVRGVEILAERPDGECVPVLPFPTPIQDRDGRLIGAVNVLVDISRIKQAEEAAERRMLELDALYQFSEHCSRANSLHDVQEAAVDAILSALRCNRAAILLFDQGGVMRFVASRGLSRAYCAAVEGHNPWTDDAPPAPICIGDVGKAGLDPALLEVIRAEGIGALAFIPVTAEGRLVGKFMAYFDQPHALSQREIDSALTIARQLGFGLERATAIQDLRESEERFRLVAESAPVMLWMSDAFGKCVYLNRDLRAFWGLAPDHVSRFDWGETLHPDDAPRVGEVLAKAMTTHSAFVVEARYRRADGALRTIRTEAQPRLSHGRFLGMIGVNVDVTDARRSEEQLRAGEQRLRLAVAASKAADWSWDAASDAVTLSTPAASLLGLPQSTRWRDIARLLAPHDRSMLRRTVKGALNGGEPFDVDIHITRTTDSEQIWLSARGQSLVTADGTLKGMIGLVSDCTERKRRENAEKLLIREVDHRAKNVLAVVQAMARLTPFHSREQYLSDFRGRLGALSRVHTLLSRGRWREVDLLDIVRDELAPHRTTADRITMDGPAVKFRADMAQPLSIILHELATNAAKYGALADPAGLLAVSWRPTGTRELILEWREHCSQPIATTNIRSGFGSTLIDSAVNQLQSTIERSWRRDGLKCTIRLNGEMLFRPEFEKTGDAPHAYSPAYFNNGRVLVVEDEALVALELQDLLANAGLEVAATIGRLDEAILFASHQEFDCALLDVNLAGKHVTPLLAILRRRQIPYALVTGYQDPGVDGPIVQKPVAADQLLATVSNLLQQRRQKQPQRTDA